MLLDSGTSLGLCLADWRVGGYLCFLPMSLLRPRLPALELGPVDPDSVPLGVAVPFLFGACLCRSRSDGAVVAA